MMMNSSNNNNNRIFPKLEEWQHHLNFRLVLASALAPSCGVVDCWGTCRWGNGWDSNDFGVYYAIDSV